MSKSFVSSMKIQDFPLWGELHKQGSPLSLTMEITARCLQNCRHCYINLPANDQAAMTRELTIEEIDDIAEQAVELGVLWCLITGGDPLVRPDFFDIYRVLKHKGLLVSVFTTATLVTSTHIKLFHEYPPRDVEVTVYGATRETYESVTRVPGSYARFCQGLDLLLASGIKVRLKAMALRSNLHEMEAIASFCRQRTKDYFRFDPQLHLRVDGNQRRNREIRSERLSPEEIVQLEQSDSERLQSLKKNCNTLLNCGSMSIQVCQSCPKQTNCVQFAAQKRLFHCGIGSTDLYIGYDGNLRLCSSLYAPGLTCDLHHISLRDARKKLITRVKAMNIKKPALLSSCGSCPLQNLCFRCPAHAFLETGDLEGTTPDFCAVAKARAEMLNTNNKPLSI